MPLPGRPELRDDLMSAPVFDHLVVIGADRGSCSFFPHSPDELVIDKQGNPLGLCSGEVSVPGSWGLCVDHAEHVKECPTCVSYLAALERFTT